MWNGLAAKLHEKYFRTTTSPYIMVRRFSSMKRALVTTFPGLFSCPPEILSSGQASLLEHTCLSSSQFIAHFQ